MWRWDDRGRRRSRRPSDPTWPGDQTLPGVDRASSPRRFLPDIDHGPPAAMKKLTRSCDAVTLRVNRPSKRAHPGGTAPPAPAAPSFARLVEDRDAEPPRGAKPARWAGTLGGHAGPTSGADMPDVLQERTNRAIPSPRRGLRGRLMPLTHEQAGIGGVRRPGHRRARVRSGERARLAARSASSRMQRGLFVLLRRTTVRYRFASAPGPERGHALRRR